MSFIRTISQRLRGFQKGPRGKAGCRLYAVGDIHGCLDLVDEVLALIARDNEARTPKKAFVVFLGDLIDRGPDSAGVIARLRAFHPRNVHPVFLRGNHEEVLLRILQGEGALIPDWLKFGGDAFVTSYGLDPATFARLEPGAAINALRRLVPKADRAFLNSFADTFRFGDYLLVHAGIRPGVALGEQSPADLHWIREPFLADRTDHGFVVVHGHTIVDSIDEQPNRIAIDTGAYASGMLSAFAVEDDQRWHLQTGRSVAFYSPADSLFGTKAA